MSVTRSLGLHLATGPNCSATHVLRLWVPRCPSIVVAQENSEVARPHQTEWCMPRQIPWLRIGAEGVAIVVSILLAFGILAAWESMQDRQSERRALQLIRGDLLWRHGRPRGNSALCRGACRIDPVAHEPMG